MKRVLLAGGSGFIGRHLHARLTKLGCTVVAPDRAALGDIHDAQRWRNLLQHEKPDAIFHCLGVVQAPDEQAFDSVHVQPTRALLDAAHDLRSKTTPIFLLGSAAEYGNVSEDRQPIQEEEIAQPLSAYGRSKLRATEAALEFARKGVHTVVVRPFNLFGAGMPATLMPGAVLAQVQNGARVIQTGDCDVIRDFLHIETAAEALAQLVFVDAPPGTIVNLCSGRGVALSEIVQAIAAAADCTVVMDGAQASPRSNAVRRCVGSPRRLQHLIGFSPPAPDLAMFAKLARSVRPRSPITAPAPEHAANYDAESSRSRRL